LYFAGGRGVHKVFCLFDSQYFCELGAYAKPYINPSRRKVTHRERRKNGVNSGHLKSSAKNDKTDMIIYIFDPTI
jgi:hypothetical protein